jgi:hypothetical protein
MRRMIDSYHLAIERLTSIDAPVIAAVPVADWASLRRRHCRGG